MRCPVSSKEVSVKDIIFFIKIFGRRRLISCPLNSCYYYRPNLYIKAKCFVKYKLIRSKSNYVLMEISAYIEIYSFKM